jgi:rhodanese-related sulfurtransferase
MSLFQNLFGGGKTVDLKVIIEQGAFLVDVREPGEFAEGTAKGAVNIPLGSVVTELTKFKGKENIIVFCRSGNRSGQAKTILEQNGFKNVINGGTWQEVNHFIE